VKPPEPDTGKVAASIAAEFPAALNPQIGGAVDVSATATSDAVTDWRTTFGSARRSYVPVHRATSRSRPSGLTSSGHRPVDRHELRHLLRCLPGELAQLRNPNRRYPHRRYLDHQGRLGVSIRVQDARADAAHPLVDEAGRGIAAADKSEAAGGAERKT
jgi:hypothetical protein